MVNVLSVTYVDLGCVCVHPSDATTQENLEASLLAKLTICTKLCVQLMDLASVYKVKMSEDTNINLWLLHVHAQVQTCMHIHMHEGKKQKNRKWS